MCCPANCRVLYCSKHRKGLDSRTTLNPTYGFVSNVHGSSQQNCSTNCFTIDPLHGRPSVVHYKLQLTYGRWSRCNSPNVSRYYYTFFRDCISINFAHVTSFLLADLRPCEWLSPHHFSGSRGSWSRCSSPNVSRAYNLHWDLLSSRLMEALC